MKDYLSGRQNVVEASATELNPKLVALVDAFGEAWLQAGGIHRLQSLWQRTDALATNELLNFGDAVKRLQEESPSWLMGQVHKIKTGDEGQSNGAIFEILALNLFSRQSCRVVPAPESMPGFDGTLFLADEARVLLSIKNHGQSSREQEFLSEATSFDEEFRRQLDLLDLQDLEVNVLAAQPLGKTAFLDLKADIASCLADLKSGKNGGAIDRPYVIVIKGMAGQYGALSQFRKSSSCRIMAPIAPNEQANFEDAIRKGCDNLFSHTKNENGDFCRAIILRLSNTASIAKCRGWAEWYFKHYPDDPVDLILLYQASVTTDSGAATSGITHYISMILGPRFEGWQKKNGNTRRLPSMSILVGTISNEQPRMILTEDGVNGIDLSDYYLYQRADVYQKAEVRDGVQVNLSNPASGIMIHAVLEENGMEVGTLSSKAEREKVLALLP